MLLKLKNIFGWLLEQVLISNFKRKIAKFLEFLPLYKANHLFERFVQIIKYTFLKTTKGYC
jgi:hypothetical protein